MTKPTSRLPAAREAFIAISLSLGLIGNGMAEGYDFNRMVSGGGGGGGPPGSEKRRTTELRGRQICLDVKPGPGNQVVFTVWSMIPEPNARLRRLNFDTGRRNPDLISSLKVTAQSPGVRSHVSTSRGSGKRFDIELPMEYPGRGKPPKGGLRPGNFIMISATLGPGQTFANLLGALHESLNPASEEYGLRISVAGQNLLGGPPPGVATIGDDATFALRSKAPQCQR